MGVPMRGCKSPDTGRSKRALRRHCRRPADNDRPEIFNTDQGSQFTSVDFTGLLLDNAIAISMDGRGAWRDNVFVGASPAPLPFASRRQLGSYLGLTPSAHDSGSMTRCQGISKAGNNWARRILIEVAWLWQNISRRARSRIGTSRRRPANQVGSGASC
jgi:hypothetical protein